MRARFYWSHMYRDVRKYVNACVPCAQRKTPPGRKPAPLITPRPAERPFQRIAMDIVGPLVTTDSGNKYILTVQDSFTRYLEAFPMPDQTAVTVAKHFVTGVVLKHGVPRQLLTDLGTNFLSKVMRNVCQALQVQNLRTTAYRPQTNDALERTHHT